MKKWIVAAVLGGLAGLAGASDNYPSRPIRLIVGYAAGGPVDSAARVYARHLGNALGQPVVIDNRAGAGGAIAATQTSRSSPDGYTLFFVGSPTLTMAPLVQKTATYKPLKDFTLVGLLNTYTNVLLVPNESALKSVNDLVSYARSHPDAMAFGSAGVGASNHLAAELLAQRGGVRFLHVPYKGNSPAVTDLIGGKIGFMFDVTGTAIGYVQGGKVRALAVTSQARNAALPGVPTVAESGLKGFDVSGWFGLIGPPGLLPAVVERLVAANREVGNNAAFRQSLARGGYTPSISGPAQFTERLRQDLALWSEVITKAKIEAQ
ncbi:tripartite tricarboxylate transporter substrate binding protein [Cupriavidus sp. P-10]|uniref:Bug family tripartite tricarboxylate transporter substrate binding protein n=1 Tax=Cupriavidus sp. P-10 TaxID=2027911 RepID=UPI000E2EE0BC|nr:tripartite tricarboxylate transporter substrate binding protein [Cupriavidus sp. P-10]BDB26218.1 tripartite tricarboxylate transporter substrate binding protein [Cupriavidus sp. P-10]